VHRGTTLAQLSAEVGKVGVAGDQTKGISAVSLAVRRAVLRQSGERPGVPLRLWQIYQAVPELKPKLAALERLPLTRRVLESALGRSGKDEMPGLFD